MDDHLGMGCIIFVLGCLALLIPIVGPFIFLVALGTAVVQMFFRREKLLVGPCPVCGIQLTLQKSALGANCPACAKRFVVQGTQFVSVS